MCFTLATEFVFYTEVSAIIILSLLDFDTIDVHLSSFSKFLTHLSPSNVPKKPSHNIIIPIKITTLQT